MNILKKLFKNKVWKRQIIPESKIELFDTIFGNYFVINKISDKNTNEEARFLKVSKNDYSLMTKNLGIMKKIEGTYKFIIPCEYECIINNYISNNIIFKCSYKIDDLFETCNIYDEDGNLIKEFNYICKISNNLEYYIVGLKNNEGNNKYGIMNDKMEIIVPIQYDRIWEIKEEFKVCIVDNNGEGYGVLDIKTNKFIVPMNKEYKYISLNNKLDYVSIVSYNGCASIYDVKKQKLVVPFKYDSVDLFNKKDEIYITELKNSKNDSNEKFSTYGFYDAKNSKEICDNRYLFIGRCEHLETGNYNIVELYTHKYGLINNKGEEVIPCLYDDIYIINKSLLYLRIATEDYYIKVKDFNKIYESKYTEFVDSIELLTLYFYTDKYFYHLDSFKGTRDEFIKYINQNYDKKSQMYKDCIEVLDKYKEL